MIWLAATLSFIVFLLAQCEAQLYRVTWYGDSFTNGPLACGSDIYGRYSPHDPTTVATPWITFKCGDRLEICADNCITAVVKDRCGGCGPKHIDLSSAAWKAIGGNDYATVRKVGEP